MPCRYDLSYEFDSKDYEYTCTYILNILPVAVNTAFLFKLILMGVCVRESVCEEGGREEMTWLYSLGSMSVMSNVTNSVALLLKLLLDHND